MKKEVIGSSNAPKAVGPYSAGIKKGSFVFLSGQLGLDPKSGDFRSRWSGGANPAVIEESGKHLERQWPEHG